VVGLDNADHASLGIDHGQCVEVVLVKEFGQLILVQGDGHGECKAINTPHGHAGTLLDRMGGFTLQVRNPDSWEGWH